MDRALAGQLGDQHRAVVADRLRLDVLERARVLVDAGHVHAALVGERVAADVGLVRVRAEVAELVEEVRRLGEPHEAVLGNALEAHLELERRQDRDEVRVAAPLAVAVHRPLDEPRALLDRDERVGHAAAGVVVGVDADATSEPSSATTCAVASATCAGSDEPFVSQRVTFSAPPSTAARRQRSA